MSSKSDANLWLMLEVLSHRRNLILGVVVSATVISVIISLILPKWYTAKAVLLPPKDFSLSLGSRGSIDEVLSLTRGLDLPVMVTSSDVYARVLKSTTIAGRIIEDFDLQSRYDTDNKNETYDALMDHAKFLVSDEGLLEIAVEDTDPQVAADMANAFVVVLDEINRSIVTERVGLTRAFLEKRIKQVRAELDSSRVAFENFQIEHHAIDFDEQIRLAIDQAVVLKADLAKLDIDIEVLSQTHSPQHSEVLRMKQRRETIVRQLSLMERTNPDSSFFSLPVADIPRIKGQYEDLYSHVKVGERLYELVLEQLEQVKLEQQQSTPTLSVLDHAIPPLIKSSPKRVLIVTGTAVLSLLFSLLLAVFLEYLQKLQTESPEDYKRVMYFISSYFGWLPGVAKRKRQP